MGSKWRTKSSEEKAVRSRRTGEPIRYAIPERGNKLNLAKNVVQVTPFRHITKEEREERLEDKAEELCADIHSAVDRKDYAEALALYENLKAVDKEIANMRMTRTERLETLLGGVADAVNKFKRKADRDVARAYARAEASVEKSAREE